MFRHVLAGHSHHVCLYFHTCCGKTIESMFKTLHTNTDKKVSHKMQSSGPVSFSKIIVSGEEKKRKEMDNDARNNTLADLYGKRLGNKVARSMSTLQIRGTSAPPQITFSQTNNSSINHSMSERRCTSDVSLWRSRTTSSCSGLTNKNYSRFSSHRRTATMLLAQRSNAQGVKDLVSSIENKCTANKSSETAISNPRERSMLVPDQECSVLSQVANDAYYKVVIGSSNGVAILIKAMNTFPQEAGLQEACCQALGNLCERNGGNQLAVQREDGIKAIVAAMRRHSGSIAVQSAACEALRTLSTLILAHADEPQKPSPLLSDVIELLQMATDMYITPTSKESAEQLLSVLTKQAECVS